MSFRFPTFAPISLTFLRGLLLLGLTSVLLGFAPDSGAAPRRFPVIAGHVEEVLIAGTGKSVRFEAKLDTGATTSALDTGGEHELYRRNGETWVRFAIKNARGSKLQIDGPVVRFANVKRANTADDLRPVVRLPACVAGVRKTEEFTLSDRSGMDYRILIGRNFMASDILVDSGKTGLATGKCRE